MEHASILFVDAMATNDDKDAFDKCMIAKDAYFALYPCAKVCAALGTIFKRLGNLEYVAEEHEEAMKYYQQSAEYILEVLIDPLQEVPRFRIKLKCFLLLYHYKNMTHFDFRSPDYFVEVIPNGVRLNHVDYTLDGDKVMDDDLHIYTIDFDARRIQRGLDFFVWEMGVADFGEWSQRLNKSPDDWDYMEETPNYLRIDGKTYKIEGADRAWPLPKLYYNFGLKGEILTEVDCETGATERKIRWNKDEA